MEDLRYIYSVGRVRVLETWLLKKEIFYNLLTADTLEAALKMLTETASYPLDIFNIKDSQGLSLFLEAQTQKLRLLANELFIEPFLSEALVVLTKDLSRSYALILRAKSNFLKDFIRKFIDLYNIKTFFRIGYQGQTAEYLNRSLIDGGYILKSELVKRFGQNLDGLYPQAIKEGIAQIEKAGDFSLLERQIEDYLTDFLRPAKYMFFGPEPIFAFCLAKENELKQLHLILLAKINRLAQTTPQERLTLSYA
jgi:vacuolar-type H+-ATPase subunit C/Vma6